MSIGSQIVVNRKKKKLTQEDLGRIINVSQETIFNWENNLETPSDAQISQIARILGTTYSNLVRDNVGASSTFNEPKIAQEMFSHFLKTEEEIIWQGNPRHPFPMHHLPQIIFGAFYFLFAVFWTIMASSEVPVIGLFGLPFIIVGISLVFRNKKGKNTNIPEVYYLLTNKRIIVIANYSSNKYTSLDLEDITNINLIKGASSTKTLVFYTNNARFNNTSAFFFNVQNGEYVLSLINEARKGY